MPTKLLVILLLSLLQTTIIIPVDCAVVVTGLDSKSRLGDQLITYAKAKWFSYSHKIPFLHRPFTNSKNFKLHEKEQFADPHANFENVIKIRHDRPHYTYRSSTLYKVGMDTYLGGYSLAWGSPSVGHSYHIGLREKLLADSLFFFADDLYEKVIENPEFAALLREMLEPIQPIKIVHPPDDRISIAVHVRTSESYPYDSKYEVKNQGLRFAPEQFYIDQIRNLSHELHNIPLYVFVFTDGLDPVGLTSRLRSGCNMPNITFESRSSPIPEQFVLQDLYSMKNFTCLIRSCSYFSGIAQLMGRHALIIRPAHFVRNDQCIVIDKTDIIIPDFEAKKVYYSSFTQHEPGFLANLLSKNIKSIAA